MLAENPLIMNIEVSNLNMNVLESDLTRLFAPYGEISSIELLRDKLNNRSRGRAFVEMAVEKEGQQAMHSLHGTELMGKNMIVTKVKYVPGEGLTPKKTEGLFSLLSFRDSSTEKKRH
jgi:RNA recognition motif-containing protein